MNYNETIRRRKNDSLEQLVVDTIVKRIKPKGITLFGSRARGEARERSDYDIAVDNETMPPAMLAQFIRKRYSQADDDKQ